MVLDRSFYVGGKSMALTEGPEGTIFEMSACTASDLGEFGDLKVTSFVAIEFASVSKGDAVNVQVEPHTDSVSRDEVVNFSGLIHGHLGISSREAKGRPAQSQRPLGVP